MRINFSLVARKDLERLKEFIFIKNPNAAGRIISQLVNGINHLIISPELGRKVEKAPSPDALRDIFILDNHIRYLKLSKTILIIRIWHQKENR